MELTDVPEGSEYYEAVRFVFEQGLMAAKAEDTFGVDSEATVGDLSTALYILMGGSAATPILFFALFMALGLLTGA